MQRKKRIGMTIMMNDNPVLGVFMHCTVCTVRVSSSDAAPVQVVIRRMCNNPKNAPFRYAFARCLAALPQEPLFPKRQL